MKFKEDNITMFVFDAFYFNENRSILYSMILLDDDSKLVAAVDLFHAPKYELYVQNNKMSLDEFETQFEKNGFTSIHSNGPQFNISLVDQNTKTLAQIEEIKKNQNHTVCAVLSPILSLTYCKLALSTADVNSQDSGYMSDPLNINFHIFTSLTGEKIIKYNDLNGLKNSKFNPALRTVFIVHGWSFDASVIRSFQKGNI